MKRQTMQASFLFAAAAMWLVTNATAANGGGRYWERKGHAEPPIKTASVAPAVLPPAPVVSPVVLPVAPSASAPLAPSVRTRQ